MPENNLKELIFGLLIPFLPCTSAMHFGNRRVVHQCHANYIFINILQKYI